MKQIHTLTRKTWLMLLAFIATSSVFAQAPVSWTSYNEAGDNTFPPPATVNLKSIAYNPVNNHIYAYGQEFFNLPAQPSGNVYTRECGIVRYNNSTGAVVSSVYDVHHDNTTLIPNSDEAGEMAIAPDGSVYVTAKRYYDATYLYDMVIIKYNSDLVEQWRYWLFSPGAADDAGIAIAVEPVTGNVVAAGVIGDNGTGTGTDFGIVKLSPAGLLIWKTVYNTSGSQADTPTDITTDNKGNTFVTGYSYSPTNGNQYTALKYNSSGIKKWTRYYNGVGSSLRDDKANSIAVDNTSGNVYVTGTSENASGNTDIATRAYDSTAAVILWTKRINTAGDSRDRGFVVKIDGSHNIYVGGDVDKDATANFNGDLLYRKYDVLGATLATKRYNGSGYNCEFGDLVLASGNTAYMTGWCLGATIAPSNGTYSLVTVKYKAGVFQWSDFFTPGQFQTCGEGYYGFKLAVNTATSEAATGGRHWMWCPGSHPNEWMIRRYNPTLREQDELNATAENPIAFNLFPNPANTFFTIETNREMCDITIVNMQGKIVYDSKQTDHTIVINTDTWAAGIYSVMVRDQNSLVVKKMVKE